MIQLGLEMVRGVSGVRVRHLLSGKRMEDETISVRHLKCLAWHL